MKKTTTVEQTFCDICGAEEPVKTVNVPAWFMTEQTEGRSCEPYIVNAKLDFCATCLDKAIVMQGYGAQGNNTFHFDKSKSSKLSKYSTNELHKALIKREGVTNMALGVEESVKMEYGSETKTIHGPAHILVNID